jgi:hypothetical protein
MNDLGTSFSVHFAPLVPVEWLSVIAFIGLLFLIVGFFKNRRGVILRTLCVAAFMLVLANPSLLEEERSAVPDVAVIVVDKSQSQAMGKRSERTEAALTSLKEQLANRDELDLRIIEAPDEDSGPARDTRLFDALDRTLSDVPQARRAGVIFLTDGQIHDVPQNPALFEKYGPVHALLTGERNERDRQLVISKAPLYGIVGQSVSVQYRIEDSGVPPESAQQDVLVTLKHHDGREDHFFVPVGQEQTLDLNIAHAGQNVFELSVGALEGEITQANNRAALLVNGVRDRLRVLLVSGQPHAGGRTWRDLLTSDPGVDLIHFTILREPDKLDSTPQNELSLIAFPFRELFEIKLYEFDLIVFDRYRLNRILPNNYFNNIVQYVNEGGALLEASGPSYATEDSIYYTALMKILPGTPTGDVVREPFIPSITEDGGRHPVTRGLSWKNAADGTPGWSPWLRQIALKKESGDILMNGANENPLLILDRVGEGRVAQLASDHIWLWSRGYKGGGPHAELLRRVVHWLMKEPELDEKALDVVADGSVITVRSQNYKLPGNTVTMTRPDGSTDTLNLEPGEDGWLTAHTKADQLGIYSFEDSAAQRRFAVIGNLNPPELASVRATDEKLRPLINASGGGVLWLEDSPSPPVRLVEEGRTYAGRGWVALRQNNDYNVTGLKDRPLLPAWLAALALLGIMVLGWWREGRTK